MSAEAMKRAALIKIGEARQAEMEGMAERFGEDYGQMMLALGTIKGLKEAGFYIEQAYKELGN